MAVDLRSRWWRVDVFRLGLEIESSAQSTLASSRSLSRSDSSIPLCGSRWRRNMAFVAPISRAQCSLHGGLGYFIGILDPVLLRPILPPGGVVLGRGAR